MPILLSFGVFFNCFERVCVAVEFHRILLCFKSEISITVSVGSFDIGSIFLVIYHLCFSLCLNFRDWFNSIHASKFHSISVCV